MEIPPYVDHCLYCDMGNGQHDINCTYCNGKGYTITPEGDRLIEFLQLIGVIKEEEWTRPID